MSRKTGIIVLIVNCLMLAGMVGVNVAYPPPEPAPLSAPMAVVGSVVGQVEVLAKGSAKWLKAEVGTVLAEGAQIRTGLFSEAGLHMSDTSALVVSPNTNFVVDEDHVQKVMFELEGGRISAAIPEQAERQYQFRSRGSDAIASVERGEFSLATDGKGTVVIDTKKGSVKLAAQGKEISVTKGRRSLVLPDKPPSKLMRIPSSVALKVRWPQTKLDKTKAKVSGSTSAGAEVLVNGILVRADKEGLFAMDVPLQEGSNKLIVTTSDSAGNSARRRSPEILVDTHPPDIKVNAKDLWK